ncbi:MAG TPA: hypothetical protein VF678_09875, partial [bacterium]
MAINRWAWRLVLAEGAVLMAAFTVFRLAFLAAYSANFAKDSAGDLLLSLLAGLRFDASAIAVYAGAPVLLFFLLSPLPWR